MYRNHLIAKNVYEFKKNKNLLHIILESVMSRCRISGFDYYF